jgi:hypothetical protein
LYCKIILFLTVSSDAFTVELGFKQKYATCIKDKPGPPQDEVWIALKPHQL